MPDAILATAATQHGVFTRAQARRSGVSRSTILRRIGRGDWIEVDAHVLRVAGAPMTDHAVVMAAVLSGGPDAVATSTTALALHRVRGFERLVPARVIAARRPPRWAASGVTETFLLPHHHRTVVAEIPTTTVARALFDLGGHVRSSRLERAVDAALAARRVSVAELATVVDDLAEHGRHGSAAMRAVLADRTDDYEPPGSHLESDFLDLVRAAGLPEPDRQADLGGHLAWVGRVDFVWRTARVVVEIDGGAFHDSVSDRAADERRDRALEAAGWIVLRFGTLDVRRRPTSVVRTVERALRSRR